MKILDVNLMVAAHRREHTHFAVASRWINALRRSGEPFAVPTIVQVGFLRLTTSRRAFPKPTPQPLAFAYLRNLLASPGWTDIQPTPRHLDVLEALCRDGAAPGDLVPDAHLAALAVEHGGTVVSFDRDFARFEGLRWECPA